MVPTKTVTVDDEYDDNDNHGITLHHPYDDKQQELTYPQNGDVKILSSSSKSNNNIEIQPNMSLIIPQKTQKQESDDPWNVLNYDYDDHGMNSNHDILTRRTLVDQSVDSTDIMTTIADTTTPIFHHHDDCIINQDMIHCNKNRRDQ